MCEWLIKKIGVPSRKQAGSKESRAELEKKHTKSGIPCGILVLWTGIKPTPTARKLRVLTTGPPGKPLDFSILVPVSHWLWAIVGHREAGGWRDINAQAFLSLRVSRWGKSKIMSSSPITSCKYMETVIDFILLGSKITEKVDCSNEIKRCLRERS